ncbi:MAG TPA: hypothetical protein VKR54_03280 [Candidatus Babeliales bacterium]|jgi:hypothetical protein|nr:hypothetical protein [Candidatus Babeliales bacterium]
MKQSKKILCGVVLLFCAHNFLFGMFLSPQVKQWRTRSVPLGFFAKKYPYIQQNVQESLMSAEPEYTYLVPTNSDTLKMFDLCPLFVQQEVSIAPDLLTELDAETIKQLYESQSASMSPKYHILRSGNSYFETENVDVNVPCVVPLGLFGHWDRTLLQLKSLDQFELAKITSLSPALCAGHALNNSRLIRNYALTGELKYLKDLHDINGATSFLLDLQIDDWLNVETVKMNVAKVGRALGVDGIDISSVSTVALFDSDLDKTSTFGVFNPEEFVYVQNVKKKIQKGLTQNNYVHVMVIGNEEAAESHGHYFCFAIIKTGNEIQYVVLDTLPGVYHLQEGSHEKNRLMFVIQNIEQGHATIKMANLRVMPQFIESVGEPNEESRLEAALANERMEESGGFENQIKLINDFSKKLNRFGVKKQLGKESKDNLVNCLNAINVITVQGKESLYPTLKELIEKRLSEI